MARRAPDPKYAAIRVDNNFFDDSIDPDERAAADELLKLATTGAELSIAIPHSVRTELDRPQTPDAVSRRAGELPFTYDTGWGNPTRLRQVESIMRGNAKPGAHEADAAHLYDSAIWAAGYFVTLDKRIHQRASKLAELLPDLWIVTPSELLGIYRDYRGRFP